MAFDEVWEALGRKGAELVIWPTQSPGQLRPAFRASRNNYFVLTSTWRNNASLLDPTGHRTARPRTKQTRDSILHASRAIKRRNVGPGYTNIAVMGAYVTLVAGEHFDHHELTDYGKARLKRFHDHTFSQGSFTEYNSPTYSITAITELARMLRHVKDAESRKLLRELNRFAWSHVARHFHVPTSQWAGPHSRCYTTLLGNGTRAYIQRATNGQVCFLPESAALESLDAHRLGVKCPPATWATTSVSGTLLLGSTLAISSSGLPLTCRSVPLER